MHILFVTSEATPWSKTGGLADVCSALPKTLSLLGRKVSIVTPYYRCVRDWFLKNRGAEPEAMYGVTLNAPMGKNECRGGVRKATLDGTNATVYFIEHNDFYGREGIYNYQGVDYADNFQRFAFLSRASLELIRRLSLEVDIIHVNDWQTALVPVYLDTLYRSRSRLDSGISFGRVAYPKITDVAGDDAPLFDRIKTVLTIHNLRHQGRFWRGAMDSLGLDWSLFSYDKMEFYGQVNYLKSGVVFADAITTVSPQYAQEIQTKFFGERLQGVLRERANDLVGILNGIDTEEWNPAKDEYIPANYDVEHIYPGKSECKARLQEELGLPVEPKTPLLGVVSRFDPQKGLDLVAEGAGNFIEQYGVQFVILGSGERELGDRFRGLAYRYPRNFVLRDTFSVALSHRIEAGADVFLMPSRYEPCGLNQMYSLRYGTLPVVHNVGGLHDTVVNGSEENIRAGIANGFLLYCFSVDDMTKALNWTLECYRHRPDDWQKMMRTAMSCDHSWQKSALEYDALYNKLLSKI